MKKLVFGLLFSICLFTSTQAQVKIGENPQNLHFNSVLELESTSKALVVTRLSTLQMDAITPLNGAVIYNTDTSCLHYFNGTEWINLCEAENAADINLVDNGDDTYTFTNAAGDDITFETPAFTSNHTGSFGATFSSGIKITDDGNTVNIEVDQVHGNSILNKTIGRTKIADDAIGVDELGDTSVNTNNLIDESVTPVKIQPSITPNQVLKTNATGTNVEWGTLDATNIAGQDLTADDASITVTGGIGTTLNATSIVVTDGGITNAKLDKTNIPLSGFGDATTDVSLGGFQINSLANPTLDDDAATKLYVDNEIAAAGVVANAALAAEVLRATTAENNIQSDVDTNEADADAAILAVQNDVDANETAANTAIALKEDTANKSTDVTLADDTNTKFPTELAVKTYVDTQVAASDQVIVSTDADNDIIIGTDGGAFYDDAALETNIATNTTAITAETTRATNAENANTTNITSNDTDITALQNDKEDTANKSDVVTLGTSDDLFPTQNAVKTYVDNQISTTNTITDGNILVGDATNTAAQVTLSGDATLANTGALTIENNAITSIKIANETILSEDILDGTIINADINTAAAIDGSKINPNFGAQNISTTGTLATGNATVTGTLDITGQTTINTGANSTTLPLIRGNDGQVLTTDGAGAATWKNPTTGIPTSTPGAIFFSDGTGTLEEMRNAADTRLDVIWDDTNKRLGIGTDSPQAGSKLQVAGKIRSEGFITTFGTNANPTFSFRTNSIDDTDTGMYRPAADEIGFSVGAVEALNIDETSGSTTVTIREKLKLEGTIEDINNSIGTAGQVLTSTITGTEWSNLSSPFALGKMNANIITNRHNIGTVDNIGTGNYRVNFVTDASSPDYVIQLTLLNAGADVSIEVVNQTINGFEVQISQSFIDNTGATPVLNSTSIDGDWFFTVTDF
ncbi:MAG: beta strand repeat-containing protein [Cellulophaga sp.]